MQNMSVLPVINSKGCQCASCIERATKLRFYNERHEDEMFRIFDANVMYVISEGLKSLGKDYNPFGKHADIRSNQRCISKEKVLQSLLDGAMPIEISKNSALGFSKLLVLSIVDGRPIHTTVYYYPGLPLLNRIEIGTFYRPDSEKWQWDDTYTTRIFNCAMEEEFRFEKSFGDRL